MKYLDSWKRWIVWLVVATLFAIACVFLSQWQFNRRAEAVAKIQLVQGNYGQQPVSLSELGIKSTFDPNWEWRAVQLRGSFIPEQAVLIRNRPLNGQPGFLQLVPFALESGKMIAIETGWIPTGSKEDFPDYLPLPSSEFTNIIARLRPAEPTLGRDAPAGQLATINIQALVTKQRISAPIYENFYARLEGNYGSEDLPKPLARPEPNEGSHLSYAFQWLLFALMAFGALWFAVREEINAKRLLVDSTYKPKVRRRLGDADKKAEDAINSK